MKRIIGTVSTTLLAGAMMFGVSNLSVHADDSQPYKVVIPGKNKEKPVTIGFNTQKELETYKKKHPINPDFPKTFQSLSQISTTYYHDSNLQGTKFNVNASRSPIVIKNLDNSDNDKVSSILTHPFGNYTMIYEHTNAQGRALAIVNNGGYLNLSTISMGDGERTWDDQISSTTVQSN
ncbi:MAG: hypothetical protein QM671_19745 [Bacillus sp. (in: firmicutes)]|uniref:hypothetical protein n=1 Tax=Bacillus sp. TaxID=1409 RepID=UPI0039E47912